jgi:hypothetical protein
MSVLSPTSDLTVKITQYVQPPQLNLNLNQTLIHSGKVTSMSQSHSFIRIGFHSKLPNGHLVEGFFNELDVI